MRKILFAAVLLTSSSLALADTLNASMIQQVHDQVKNSFYSGCSKNVTGTMLDMCRCLADKTQASLDDKALSKCNNSAAGTDCIVKAVKDASVIGTSKENINDCKTKVMGAASAAPATPATTTTTTSTTTTPATATTPAATTTTSTTTMPAAGTATTTTAPATATTPATTTTQTSTMPAGQ